MMEPISGLAALYEILRRKAAGDAESTAPAAKTVREQAGGPAQRTTLEELEREIRSKLKGLPPDALAAPGSKRWVIASLLSWEFEPGLQNEAKFNALVRSVQHSIDGDARLRMKFERIMEQLSR